MTSECKFFGLASGGDGPIKIERNLLPADPAVSGRHGSDARMLWRGSSGGAFTGARSPLFLLFLREALGSCSGVVRAASASWASWASSWSRATKGSSGGVGVHCATNGSRSRRRSHGDQACSIFQCSIFRCSSVEISPAGIHSFCVCVCHLSGLSFLRSLPEVT